MQLSLERLELRLQVPRPRAFGLLDDDLQLAARLVNTRLGKHPYLRAIFQRLRALALPGPEHRTRDLSPGILQGEVPVTASLFF